jgi:hypothetical protein
MFLAFSQHVQYWKTKKQVFVSDYQGTQLEKLSSESCPSQLECAQADTSLNRREFPTIRSTDIICTV